MLFRYRENEARKFKSEADVPEGEGWQDTPVTPMSELEKVYDPEVGDVVWRKPGAPPAKKPAPKKPAPKKVKDDDDSA